MDRIIWYLKQLLPLNYVSTYTESGDRKRATFRMFLGRCYDINVEQLTG